MVIDLATVRRAKNVDSRTLAEAILRGIDRDDTGRSEAYDLDDYDAVRIGAASVDLAEFGFVVLPDYALAEALRRAYPDTEMEGRPGAWIVRRVRR